MTIVHLYVCLQIPPVNETDLDGDRLGLDSAQIHVVEVEFVIADLFDHLLGRWKLWAKRSHWWFSLQLQYLQNTTNNKMKTVSSS